MMPAAVTAERSAAGQRSMPQPLWACPSVGQEKCLRTFPSGRAMLWLLMQVVSQSEGRDLDRERGPQAPAPAAEPLVQRLYESLTPSQRGEICFAWDHTEPDRGLLRSFIANHWQVTEPCVRSSFFTAAQQSLIHAIFRSLLDERSYPRFMHQLADDTKRHPWGQDQSIAIFGDPATGPFQFVFTGRHVTLRADGGSLAGSAFGGPIFYAHSARGRYREPPHHPGNIFWYQAIAAGHLYSALDQHQRDLAEIDALPEETAIGFGGPPRGISAESFTQAQSAQLVALLNSLVAPFRESDRRRVARCIARQGGLKRLSIAFAREHRISAPEWDHWRIEGPSFVWHFRGWPHVHGWVNVADAPGPPANAHSGMFIFPGHDLLQ
jgi:hypothetical protein